MINQWDITIYDRSEQPALVAETKTRLGVSPEWARQFRANLAEDHDFPVARYFMLAFPDKFYLWDDSDVAAVVDRAPDYEIDARPLLRSYFENTSIDPAKIHGSTFILIFSSWLSAFVHSYSEDEIADMPNWMLDSELYGAIAGGHFRQEVTA